MRLTPRLNGPLAVVALVAAVFGGAHSATAEAMHTAYVAGAASPDAASAASATRVLAISVDGLTPRAITRLGRDGAPHLHRLLKEGASTLNARTAVEQTITLPNHTSMMSGRRIDRARGGHGVTWNDDRPGSTVQAAAGHPVESVFDVVHDAGGSTALFASKDKFSIFERSWDTSINRYEFLLDHSALVKLARRDLVETDRALTFLHLSLPDLAGHASGFRSRPYLRAVAQIDALLGKLLRAVDRRPELASDLVVVLTADHGGVGTDHSDNSRLGNYRVPFVAWGAGVSAGRLYAMNAGYRDPGTRQPGYAGRPPVRNGDLANLATDLLGLGPVDGSLFNADQELSVR